MMWMWRILEHMKLEINEYADFVKSTTSRESLRTEVMMDRMMGLQYSNEDTQFSQLLTASIGMQAESGEFSEVLKKVIFQGKEWNEENKFHMMRELGDVLWYWVQGCMALGYTPEEVLEENIRKLSKRYPQGFEILRSEVREEGDI
jgi:NTP pyrophosphatase (non-canonical NTP hydrolase)